MEEESKVEENTEKVEEKQQPLLKEDKYIKRSIFNSVFLVSIIVIILIAILAGIKLFSPPDQADIIQDIIEKGQTEHGYVYNGYVFIEKDNLWHTQRQVGNNIYNLHFHFSPGHVDQIPVKGSLDKDLDTSIIYITHDPLEENTSLIALASLEANLNLVKGLGARTIPACSKNESKYTDRKNACAKRPIITCDNTEDAVIFIKTAETTEITLNDNCIIIQGKDMELLKAVDKMLYDFYGITELNQTN
jgi:hypothetical protein